MNAPSISIKFIEQAVSAITRGSRGVVGLILTDISGTTTTGVDFVATSASDIPDTVSDTVKGLVKQALIGYVNRPQKVCVKVLTTEDSKDTTSDNLFAIKEWIKKNGIDYLAMNEKGDLLNSVKDIVLALREEHNKVKFVANLDGDNEGLITLVSSPHGVSQQAFTPRMAGFLAGTPLTMSATYGQVQEMDSDIDMDSTVKATYVTDGYDGLVNNGKLAIMFDSEKAKVVRAVNSLQTTTAEKGESFKKIKIVEVMDLIATDIRTTMQDSYIGKYNNSYDNKCLLITAINGYFNQLITDGILSVGVCELDLEAQRNYLQSKGIDVTTMTDDEIKQADTGPNVFLTANVTILDAIEDITLNIYI